MGSPRVKGEALKLELDGVDYWADATSVVLDGEYMTTPVLCGPPEQRRIRSWFDVEAVQSTAPGSLWRLLLEHEGEQVPYTYAPHGNHDETDDEPHFHGTLVIPPPAPLGGAAGRNVSQTFTTRMYVTQGTPL